jgi:glutamate carboxypeptidase
VIGWIAAEAARIAAGAPDEIRALVAVSTPSGDVAAAERAVDVVCGLLHGEVELERVPCSTAGQADDLVARVQGTGTRRLLLLGHLDTVIAHDEFRPLHADPADPDRLVGSGACDMKGGDVLALGVLRALAERRDGAPEFGEVALLLVNDEEWRVAPFAHCERFAGFDACLCFEAGQRGPDGQEGVVVRRKAAGTIRVTAFGREAHSGSAPDKGANALLALADAARAVASQHDPQGEDALTSVPTIIRSGNAFNVVPGTGELIGDMRAARADAFQRVLDAVPDAVEGVKLEAELLRMWPGMDAREATGPVLGRAADLLGAPIHAGARGGASDASHLSSTIPVTIDGLGPRGGNAHHRDEYVSASSLEPRAAVALAVVAAVLGG